MQTELGKQAFQYAASWNPFQNESKMQSLVSLLLICELLKEESKCSVFKYVAYCVLLLQYCQNLW